MVPAVAMLGPIVRALARRQAAVALLVLEVGFGFAVSVQAFVMGQWFSDRASRPTGIDANVLVVTTDLYAGDPDSRAFVADLRRRDLVALRAIPGAAVAVATLAIPQTRTLQPQALRADTRWALGWMIVGQPGTRDVLGVDLVAGRDLTDDDQKCVVITGDLADALYGGNAVGKSLYFRGRVQPYTVVGVAGHMRGASSFAAKSDNVVFASDELPLGRELTYLVRAEPGRVDDVRERVVGALTQAFPERVVSQSTIVDMRRALDASARGGIAIFNFMVVLAVMVTLLGALAMSSFLVSERTKQIGIRRALGATKTDVARFFLVENWLVTTFGLLLGLPLTFILNFIVRREQPDLTVDWQSIAVGMAMFWAAGLLAAFVPALRATAIPPSAASKTV